MKTVSLFEVESHVLEAVVKIFNQSEKSLNEDVEKLKKWAESQPHLPEIPATKSLQNFLIRNKGSFEKTKINIDRFYTIRSFTPHIFQNSNPKLKDMKEIMETIYLVPLPKLSKDMHRIYFGKVKNEEKIGDLDLYKMVAHAINIQEMRYKEDVMLAEVAIVDLQGVNYKLLSKITPSFVQEIIAFITKSQMLRFGGLYIVNYPPIVEKLVAFGKSIVKPKLYERLHLCKDFDEVIQTFSKKIIPRDYGGEEKSLEELQEALQMKFVEYQNRFDELEQLKVDENLRPEKLKNDEFLGFYGNFKKLEID